MKENLQTRPPISEESLDFTIMITSVSTDLISCSYTICAQSSSLGKRLLAHHFSVSSNPILSLIIFHSILSHTYAALSESLKAASYLVLSSASVPPPAFSTRPTIVKMSSDPLRHRVHLMQTEADLLDEHARLLSIFASELSSFASTLSFHSHEIYAQSDRLHRFTSEVMAGGPSMDITDPDTNYRVGVARVTDQAARAVETIVIRSWVRKTLHALTKTLAGQGPELTFEEQLAVIRDCESAPEKPLTGGYALATLCRMALELGEELRDEPKSGVEEDIELNDVIVGKYSSRDAVVEDAEPAFAVSKELLQSPKRKESSNEKVLEWSSGSCGTISVKSGEEQSKDGTHGLRSCGRTVNSATSSPSPREHQLSTTPEASDALPALGPIWKLWSNSWEEEDEYADWPDDEPSGQDSDDDDESDIYSPDLPSYEEALTELEPVQDESERIAEFLRNPYDMATRTHISEEWPVQRSLVLEAAERMANPSLASAPLENCAAAML